MPMVNGKEFSYTAKGKKDATAYKNRLKNKKTKKNKTVRNHNLVILKRVMDNKTHLAIFLMTVKNLLMILKNLKVNQI